MSPSLRRPSAAPGEDRAELGHVLSRHGTRFDGRGELAAVARLLPVVAEEVRASELLDRDLGLPGPVGAHQRNVLARLERVHRVEHLDSRGHRDHHLARERPGRAFGGGHAQPLRDDPPATLVDVP